MGLIPGLGRCPAEGKQPTPVFWPGESHGQRSLMDYSPWSPKELDTTEETQHACTQALEPLMCPKPRQRLLPSPSFTHTQGRAWLWLQPLHLQPHLPPRWRLPEHLRGRWDPRSLQVQLSHQSHWAHLDWVGMLPHKATPSRPGQVTDSPHFIETEQVKHSEEVEEYQMKEQGRKSCKNSKE